MILHFSEIFAAEVGVNAAIVYDYAAGWIYTNAVKKRKTAYRNGKIWTYSDKKTLDATFANVMKPRTLRDAIKKLVDKGYLYRETVYNGNTKQIWLCLGDRVPLIPTDDMPFRKNLAELLKWEQSLSDGSFLPPLSPQSPTARGLEGPQDNNKGVNIKDNNKGEGGDTNIQEGGQENDTQKNRSWESDPKTEDKKSVVVPSEFDSVKNNNTGYNLQDNTACAVTDKPVEVRGFSTIGSVIDRIAANNSDLFASKKPIHPGDIIFQNPDNPELTPLLRLGDSLNIKRATLTDFIKRYGLNNTLTQLCHLHNASLKNDIKNPGGWLRKALEARFVDTDANIIAVDKEKKALKEQLQREEEARNAEQAAKDEADFEQRRKWLTPLTYGNPGPNGRIYPLTLRRMKFLEPGRWDTWPEDFYEAKRLVMDPILRIPLFEPIEAQKRDFAIRMALDTLDKFERDYGAFTRNYGHKKSHT